MRGIVIFAVMIVIAIIFCGIVPFTILPSIDAAMALPVISVPGEKLCKDCVPLVGDFTNTMVGTLLADVLVLLFFIPVFRGLKKVPGRMQMLVELVVDALYSLASSVAGPVKARRIFPLMATIFIFLLMANWLELVPGVDSIGLIHCAEEGFSGYPTKEGPLGITQLKVNENLDSGETATEADYQACHHKEEEDEEGAAAVTAEEGEGGEGEEGHEEAAAAATAEEAHEEGRTDIYVVTPFIRAAATDLNLTLALAVIAVVVIQYFGLSELGVGYLAKFINTPALGRGDVMSFGVGFLELISEFSKILSFAFRLFGNIFAGQVLLFVIPFLVATLLPGAVYGLEFAVGLIQAAVFAMLFLVFSSMAMTSHEHHEEEHEH